MNIQSLFHTVWCRSLRTYGLGVNHFKGKPKAGTFVKNSKFVFDFSGLHFLLDASCFWHPASLTKISMIYQTFLRI